ncbi:Toxin ParE1 [Planctomycetes bacterium MalM25]|nr:Toxin ParE1 [Planctomycetes bacterium MalM25]
MTRVVYSEACLKDFAEVLDYYDRVAPEQAGGVVRELMDFCELISTQPRMGAVAESISPGLRCITHGRYVIFYRYDEREQAVRIRRVLHHSRDTGSQSFE